MDIRYHIVSIAAVFLALATGIAVGTGPLSGGAVDQGRVAPADRQQTDRLRQRVAALADIEGFEASFGEAVTPTLVAERLAGRDVVVLALPQAPQDVVDAVREALGQAGAVVEPTVHLSERLLDPTSRQLVEELSSQLSGSVPNVVVPPGTASYDRAGVILARALVTRDDAGEPSDGPAANIAAAFEVAGLITPEGDLRRRASLVLIVSGPRGGSDEATQARNAIVAALARALDDQADGVVVAGPPRSGRAGGVVASIRADAAIAGLVSTVDVIGTPSGRVSAVYALAEQAQGVSGHYGVGGGSDDALAELPAPAE